MDIRHDLVAVQVTDPREMELPNLGRLIFQDAETGEHRPLGCSCHFTPSVS